jgi:hypothetical protein
MSGVEIVGVILGVVPLIISGLEHYNEGWSPPAHLGSQPQPSSDINIQQDSCQLKTY